MNFQQTLRQFQSATSGHIDIGQEEVNRASKGLGDLDGGVAIRSGQNRVTGGYECDANQIPNRFDIFGHDNGDSSSRQFVQFH